MPSRMWKPAPASICLGETSRAPWSALAVPKAKACECMRAMRQAEASDPGVVPSAEQDGGPPPC